MLNDLDRFLLVADVIDRVTSWGHRAVHLKQALRNKCVEYRGYIERYGQDMQETRAQRWRNEPTPGTPDRQT